MGEFIFLLIGLAISCFLAILKLAAVIACGWGWVLLPLILCAGGFVIIDLD